MKAFLDPDVFQSGDAPRQRVPAQAQLEVPPVE